MADRQTQRGSRRTGRASATPSETAAAVADPPEVEELRHRKGCPAKADEANSADSRVERFSHTTPDGEEVEIVRCVECGAQVPEE